MTVTVYLAYHKDDEPLVAKLESHLSVMRRQSLIAITKDAQMKPGANHREAQVELLEAAQLIIFCVSPDFNASDWIWTNQIVPAMDRHEKGKVTVVPLLLRPVTDWQDQPYGKLQQVPANGKAITSWTDRDEAFGAAVARIRSAVEFIKEGKLKP